MPVAGPRPRVLVIDDEPLLGQTIRLGLGEALVVTCEVSGEAGLTRILSQEDYAVILCDLSLPDLGGAEIYAAIKRERPELLPRFVVMTGGAFNDEARSFLDAHVGRVLSKPFMLKDVLLIVDQIIEESAAPAP